MFLGFNRMYPERKDVRNFQFRREHVKGSGDVNITDHECYQYLERLIAKLFYLSGQSLYVELSTDYCGERLDKVPHPHMLRSAKGKTICPVVQE